MEKNPNYMFLELHAYYRLQSSHNSHSNLLAEHPTTIVKIKEWRSDARDRSISDWSTSVKADKPFTFYNSYDGRMCKSIYFF